MNDIFNNEIIIRRKTPNKITNYITVILVLITSFLVLSVILNYDKYITIKMQVTEDYNVEAIVKLEEVDKIINSNKIEIKNKTYKYKVRDLKEITIVNNINYQCLSLNINIEDKNKIKNLVLEGKIKIKNQKLISHIINNFK